jgi:DNA gyrase/topoisomerase IV subunit A
MALQAGDELTHMVAAGEQDTLLLVTDRGRLFTLAAAEAPLMGIEKRGRPLRQHVPLLPDERITAVGSLRGPAEGEPLVLVTDLGLVFRVGYTAAASAGGGARLVELAAPHLPAVVIPARGDASLFIVTTEGTAVRLPEAAIPSGGILAPKLRPHERVVGALLVDDASAPLLVSSDGYVCRRQMNDFAPDRSRRKALLLGPEARLAALVSDQELEQVALGSADGRVMCVALQGIPISERPVRGKRVVDGEWVGPVGMAAGIGTASPR